MICHLGPLPYFSSALGTKVCKSEKKAAFSTVLTLTSWYQRATFFLPEELRDPEGTSYPQLGIQPLWAQSPLKSTVPFLPPAQISFKSSAASENRDF